MEEYPKETSKQIMSVINEEMKSWALEDIFQREVARQNLISDIRQLKSEYFGNFTADSSYAKNISWYDLADDLYKRVLERAGFFYTMEGDEKRKFYAIRDGVKLELTNYIKSLVTEILKDLGKAPTKYIIEEVMYHLSNKAKLRRDLLNILSNYIVTKNGYVLNGLKGKFLKITYQNIMMFFTLFKEYLDPDPQNAPNPRYHYTLEELIKAKESGDIKPDEDISDWEDAVRLWNRIISVLPFPKRLPIDYNPEAKAPRWEQFINEVLDKEYHTAIKRFVGYILYPDIMGHLPSAALFVGDGANGKTVFIHIITTILGKNNVSSVPMQRFKDKFSTKSMEHKLLNAAADLPKNALFDTGFVKMVLGGDRIPLEGKYQQPYEGRITAKHIFAANELPPTNDKTLGFYRRFLIFVFPRQFLGDRADPLLIKKLNAEKEGIFNWMLEGYRELLETYDFEYPRSLEEITEMYEYASDSLKRFISVALVSPEEIDEKLMSGEIDPSLIDEDTKEIEIKPSDLYAIYKAYCKEKNYTAKNPTVFYRDLVTFAPYIRRFKKNGERYYGNLILLYRPSTEVAKEILKEELPQKEKPKEVEGVKALSEFNGAGENEGMELVEVLYKDTLKVEKLPYPEAVKLEEAGKVVIRKEGVNDT